LRLYVINLDRSPDRLAHITKVFADLELKFTRIPAVDGNEIDEAEYQRQRKDSLWDPPLIRTEIGCFLSHRKFLQMVVDQDEPYAAVFEDDVKLSPHIKPLLSNYDWIKSNTDIVKLDTANTDCWLKPLRKIGINPYQCGQLISAHCCAGGYIISRKAAIRLLALTGQAFSPIDNIYYDPYCGILQTINVQQIVPAPVVQVGLESNIWKGYDLRLGERKHVQTKNIQPGIKKISLPAKRTLLYTLKRELLRFYRRYLRPFGIKLWYEWIRGYHSGKIPFG